MKLHHLLSGIRLFADKSFSLIKCTGIGTLYIIGSRCSTIFIQVFHPPFSHIFEKKKYSLEVQFKIVNSKNTMAVMANLHIQQCTIYIP